MYSVRRLRDVRELELFLFGGVSETAEQMYERDSYGHSEIRTTRQPVSDNRLNTDFAEGSEIGQLEIDLGTAEFITYDCGGSRDHPVSLAGEEQQSTTLEE